MKTRPAFLGYVTALCLIASAAQAGVYRMTLKDVAFADGGRPRAGSRPIRSPMQECRTTGISP
jgi:hypothetical protein